MKKNAQILKHLRNIQIVRSPRHRLSTFGASQISYTLVTDMPDYPDRSRLRRGLVKAERPQIITVQALKERFQGFGDEAKDYAEWLVDHYGEALKGLEYQFKNEYVASKVELDSPDRLLNKLVKDFDSGSEYHNALIRGSEKVWELSIMKFIVEETLTSFHTNFQELKERGFFDGEQETRRKQQKEIIFLFQKAKADPSFVPHLAKKLKEFELFDEYQDQFFQLFK